MRYIKLPTGKWNTPMTDWFPLHNDIAGYDKQLEAACRK